MEPAVPADAAGDGCPLLERSGDHWFYRVAGYCRALPPGVLMIPTLFEYRTWCSTADHPACPFFRSRGRPDAVGIGLWARNGLGGSVVAVGEAGEPAGAPGCAAG